MRFSVSRPKFRASTGPAQREPFVILGEQIDQLHVRLVSVDLKIRTWAKRNLSKITIDNEQMRLRSGGRARVRKGSGPVKFTRRAARP